MREVRFSVQGSASEPYSVVFVKDPNGKLSASCSCPAGLHGRFCKHRVNILNGITEGIVSDNVGDVKMVQDWLAGTDVEQALMDMQRLEAEALRVKKELALIKKKLANAMS